MDWVSMFRKALDRLQQRGIDLSSLQFRLTLGVTLVSIAGLGGTTGWIHWKMQQMLMTSQEKDITFVVEHLPPEIAESQLSGQPNSMQQAIDHFASLDVWMWVKDTDGTMLAQSATLQTSPIKADLVALSTVPLEPEVQLINDHYVIVCGSPIQVNGTPLGQFYLAKDVTQDYLMILAMGENLRLVTVLAIALIALMVGVVVQRSLSPLRQINHLASRQTENMGDRPRLNPEQVPTEVKGLAEICNSLSEQLSATGKRQRQFANDVSHELRTPLSVVYGYLQSTLRRGTNLTPHQQEALEIAVSETERTIQLLQGLLDMARADSLSMPFQIETLALNDVVTGIATMTETVHHRAVRVEADGIPVLIQADRNYLQQVLLNLVDNAIQYSDADQPIALKLSHCPGWGIVEVSDRGSGIPIAHQSRIFEPFYRVDPSRCRTTGGVGLGLSIVKSLVEGMGGEVAVHSSPGQGSTFLVKLPSPARQ